MPPLPEAQPKLEWTALPGLDLPLIGREEAHQMLPEIYNWFSEGFDTIDLKETKALLGQLESN